MITQASIWAALTDAATNGVFCLPVNAGAPSNGGSGTGAGLCGPGSLLIDTTNKILYINTNTKASPTWTSIGGASTGVTINGIQTLTNKTLTAPVINQPVTLYPVQTLAGAGSTQTDAAAITLAASGIVLATGGNGTVGIKLPVGVVGMRITVVNDTTANAVIKVYGNATDSATINGTTGSTAYSQVAKTSVDFICAVAAKWQTLPILGS